MHSERAAEPLPLVQPSFNFVLSEGNELSYQVDADANGSSFAADMDLSESRLVDSEALEEAEESLIERLLLYLSQPRTHKEVAAQFGFTQRHAKEALDRLVELGRLVRLKSPTRYQTAGLGTLFD
jgi:hypothetical protein